MCKRYDTPQENFWAGDFGIEYMGRNKSKNLFAANIHFFSNLLKNVGPIEFCIEFGANIGMNLKALQLLFPGMLQKCVEINPEACKTLRSFLGEANVFQGSILDYQIERKTGSSD